MICVVVGLVLMVGADCDCPSPKPEPVAAPLCGPRAGCWAQQCRSCRLAGPDGQLYSYRILFDYPWSMAPAPRPVFHMPGGPGRTVDIAKTLRKSASSDPDDAGSAGISR